MPFVTAAQWWLLRRNRGTAGSVVVISPSSVTLNPGQSQQFTVQGVGQQAYAWLAVGGTVNSSGLFTATSIGNAAVSVVLAGQTNPSATSYATITPATSVVQIASSLDAVLRGVTAMLAQMNQFSVAQTWISLDPDGSQFPLAGGPFAVVCPGTFRRDAGLRIGAGRFAATFEGTFTIDVIDVGGLDIGQQDIIRLTASSGNLLSLVHQVQDAMDGQFIQDPAGNFLSIEPVWVEGQEKPQKYQRAPNYGGVRLTFSLKYQELRTPGL